MNMYLMEDTEFDVLMASLEKISAVDIGVIRAFATQAAPVQYNRGIATIKIEGILEPERTPKYDYLGLKQTAYSDIQAQIQEAKDKGVRKVRFEIDRSPGGNVIGLLPTMKAIASLKNSGIQTESVGSGVVASATYMLASQADTVSSTSEADIWGSFGVIKTMAKKPFIKTVSNHESPNKAPDLDTEDGITEAKDQASDIYNVIAPYVAKARNTTMDKINSDWGKGGTMTAKTALARGMINMIQEPKLAGRSGATKGTKTMDMATLKAEHPDLYKAAFDAGKEAGKAEFQEMAEAHITLAETSGAVDRALEDIKAGNPVGPKVYAFHNAEGIKRAAIKARGEESPPAIGEGEDQQAAAAAAPVEDKDNVLVGDAKAFYDGMVINV